MPNKSSLELSDVQETVFKELDVLTDAFVSTFNELGKIIKEYSDEVNIVIDNFIREKTAWRPYNSQCFDLSFNPFRKYALDKKFSINNLEQNFFVGGQKVLLNEVMVEAKKEQLDVLEFYWGFSYDIEDEPTKFFYVQILKDKSLNGATLSKSDYEEFAMKIKTSVGIDGDYFYYLEHPDDGESEYFYIWLDFFKYYHELSKFFKICKDELIEKFLSKIKD